MIDIARFRKENHLLMNLYRKLKCDVFVREFGWNIPIDENGRTKEDQFDIDGYYVSAHAESMIGVVRGITFQSSIPYYQMINHHFGPGKISLCPSMMATVTSLAVIADYRGKKIILGNNGCYTTVAEAIILQLMMWLGSLGVEVVFVNVSLNRAFYLFRKLGFQALDPPFSDQNHPYKITNMGLILRNSSRIDQSELMQLVDGRVEELKSIEAYFKQRSSILDTQEF